MLVLFDVSFVCFCFILVNGDLVKPRPLPPSYKTKCTNITVFMMEESDLYIQFIICAHLVNYSSHDALR